MSLGIFRTIRGSYGDKYQKQPDRIIRRLNEELKARGLPEFHDPDRDERRLRRLPCGNAGASTFGALEKLAADAGLSWTLGRLRGERMIAIPIDFAGTFSVDLGRVLFFIPAGMQDFASVRTIHDEVIAMAPLLAIPLANGVLSDVLIERIGDCNGVSDDEPPGLLENERGLWLDLYCATRYCLEDSTPLVIA